MLLRRKVEPPIQEKLDFLLNSQFWPLDKLEEYQWTKLMKLLSYSYKNIKFYRKLFNKLDINPAKINSFKDFSKIPMLTKSTIQNNFNDLTSDLINKNEMYLDSTGGSTGQPLNFYYDRKYYEWEKAAAIRAWKYFVGFKKNELEAVVWGAERDVGKGLNIKKIIYSLLRKGQLPLNTFDLDPDLIRKFFKLNNIIRPKILRGYASSLFFIAKFIEENQLKINSPKVIISSAEMMWPEMRIKVENIFGAKVYDSYGCREVSQIATECSSHNGLHIVMENQYVELEDNQILVTNLNNFGMPLIRYKIGDLAEKIITDSCSCGRKTKKLIGLRGRESEMIVLPNGKIIHGEYFTHLFYGIHDVQTFNVEFHVKQVKLIIRCNDISEKDEEKIKETIEHDFSVNNVEFLKMEIIQKTITGKYRFITIIEN
ncbi:MAG: hypothetical protein K8S18_06485 [Desulfobacula sp.]|nr:hypothetical protein [Desulfobacula sp.]